MIYCSHRLKYTEVSFSYMIKLEKTGPWRLKSHVEFSATSLSEKSLCKLSLWFAVREIMQRKTELL